MTPERRTQEGVASVETLLEALPYIRQFHGRTVVIKYGGAAMRDEELREALGGTYKRVARVRDEKDRTIITGFDWEPKGVKPGEKVVIGPHRVLRTLKPEQRVKIEEPKRQPGKESR